MCILYINFINLKKKRFKQTFPVLFYAFRIDFIFARAKGEQK